MFLLVTVKTITGDILDILMSEYEYNIKKDWMFSACNLQVVGVVGASEKGVVV